MRTNQCAIVLFVTGKAKSPAPVNFSLRRTAAFGDKLHGPRGQWFSVDQDLARHGHALWTAVATAGDQNGNSTSEHDRVASEHK
jgi:hypothetical protein